MDEKYSIDNPELETFRLRFMIEDTSPIVLHILDFDINQRNDNAPEFVEIWRWTEIQNRMHGFKVSP